MSPKPTPRQKRLRVQVVLGLVGLGAGLGLCVAADNPTAAQRAARLSDEYGIRVEFGDPATFFVPPYGSADAVLEGVQITPADAESARSALKGVERALRQYPKGFVAKLIGAIFIAGGIRIGGATAGGTVGPKWIILAAPESIGRESVYATSFIGVHHELSSFALRHDPETWQGWAQFSPTGWEYRTDPREKIALARQASPAPDTGFLSAYGASSLENDFNVYAEKMFTEPETVVALARTHEPVRKKLQFILAKYVEIDSRMAGVFQDLGFELK